MEPACTKGTHCYQGNVLLLSNREDHISRISNTDVEEDFNTITRKFLFLVLEQGLCFLDVRINFVAGISAIDNM